MDWYRNRGGFGRHLARSLAVVGCLSLCAAACRSNAIDSAPTSTSVVAPKPVAGGKLVYGIEADPNGFDPTRNAWDPAGLLVSNAIFDTLTAFDEKNVARPYLAKSLEPNADYTAWTLNLREGVQFHDGTPLNADAIVKFFNAIMASAITGPPAQYFASVEKANELSVVLRMKEPWAAFPALLTGQGGTVLAPAQLDDPEGPSHPIGTGPFRLVEWKIGQRISLEKNPHYWRSGLPYLDNLDFKIIEDGRARVAELRDGSVDVIHASHLTETQELDALDADGPILVAHDPGITEPTYVLLNTAKPPLDDLRVRQALAYAVDLDALAEGNNWPRDRLTDGPFAPASTWYESVPFPRNDPDRARQLVADYEREHGPIAFELSGSHETGVLQQLTEQWKAVGIDATVKIIEFKTNVILAVSGKYDALLFRYFAAPDPDVLWHFWSSKTVAPIGALSLNFAHLGDPVIDEGLNTGRASADPATRKAAYTKVVTRFAELVPFIWLYRTDWVIASSRKVQDAKNVTLPDGQPAAPYSSGIHRLTQTWLGAKVP